MKIIIKKATDSWLKSEIKRNKKIIKSLPKDDVIFDDLCTMIEAYQELLNYRRKDI